MRVEYLVNRCKDEPYPLKEDSPAQNHLRHCHERDENLAYRKIQEQHKQQREEEVQRQEV